MVEPADAKEWIDEAIEREEEKGRAEREEERRFRDRLSLLVGLFAVLLAVIHVVAAGSQRESVLRTVQASDSFNYMQAKIIRETVLRSSAATSGIAAANRAAMLKEADRLRHDDAKGHGIGQLQAEGDRLRKEGETAAAEGERYEMGETAFQVAIVLLSIALISRSRAVVGGAVALAVAGLAVTLVTALSFG
ncbi:DUF4337 family protein [Sphingomonas ginkgonis]|uniref:DUF4337 family protein n=1 Tax=Sphingomonas ginkgonis TaxID=2315330 RepID=A0A429VBQ3_9SPHN|nr:DUF4337 family protein [Sphingomonas ginkgonis]RST31415.1 DUF4337 family protein [Sphingomonas ginkgonis]